MSDKIALSLTTRIRDAQVFTVDGVEYHLLGLEHLSSETENTVMALLARHVNVATELEAATSLNKGEAQAAKLKKIQDMIIARMTDLPPDVVEALPMSQKAKLFEAIQEILSDEDDDLNPEKQGTPEPAVAHDAI